MNAAPLPYIFALLLCIPACSSGSGAGTGPNSSGGVGQAGGEDAGAGGAGGVGETSDAAASADPDAAGPTETGDDATDGPGTDPDAGGGGTGDDTPPADVVDDPEEIVEPDPALQVSVSVVGGLEYLRFGQTAELVAEVTLDGEPLGAPDGGVTLTAGPTALAGFFSDQGGGAGSFTQTDVDWGFQTTEVTVTAAVAHAGLQADGSVSFKVLGNLWIADWSDGVVREHRSDTTLLGVAVPGTYLEQPWSLLQLDEGVVAVGNQYDGIEAFDLDGNHLFSFDQKDSEGQGTFGIFGGEAMVRHPMTGHIWVGGPLGEILRFSDDGVFLDRVEFPFEYNGINAGGLVATDKGEIVMVVDGGGAGLEEMLLLDAEGEIIGDYAENPDVELSTYVIAETPDGGFVIGGQAASWYTGRLARVAQSGKWLASSPAFEDLEPRRGLSAFGHDYLTSTNEGSVAWISGDFEVIDADITGETSNYAGIIVLGGH